MSIIVAKIDLSTGKADNKEAEYFQYEWCSPCKIGKNDIPGSNYKRNYSSL